MGKTLDCLSCFPLHFFRALPLPACFTTEHSTVEASLFVNSRLHVCVNEYALTNNMFFTSVNDLSIIKVTLLKEIIIAPYFPPV